MTLNYMSSPEPTNEADREHHVHGRTPGGREGKGLLSDVVFSRANVWFPSVVRQGGELVLTLGAGADANHDPRTFTLPISPAHLAVIRDDLARHLLLWSALIPLCQDTGVRDPLNESAAVGLLDPILLAAPLEVEAFFHRVRWDRDVLIAHGADIELLERGEILAATQAATVTSDWVRVQEYHANRRRAERGVVLSGLDAAILQFTGQVLHASTVPRRLPDAVDPELLPTVLHVIAAGEAASAGMQIDRVDPRGGRQSGKRAQGGSGWDQMSAAVEAAVRQAYPDLAVDAVATVSFLLCSEATDRARHEPARTTRWTWRR